MLLFYLRGKGGVKNIVDGTGDDNIGTYIREDKDDKEENNANDDNDDGEENDTNDDNVENALENDSDGDNDREK